MSNSKVNLSQVETVRNSMNVIGLHLQNLNAEQTALVSECSRRKEEAIEKLKNNVSKSEDEIAYAESQIRECRSQMTSGEDADKERNAQLQSKIDSLNREISRKRAAIDKADEKIRQIERLFESVSAQSRQASVGISGNEVECAQVVRHLDSVIAAIRKYMS